MAIDQKTKPQSGLDPFEMPHDGGRSSFLESASEGESEWSCESLHQHLWILGALPVGICLVRDGRLCYANRRLAEIMGFAHESELIDRNLLDFIPVNSRLLPAVSLKTAVTTSTAIPLGEIEVIRSNGTLAKTLMIVGTIEFLEQATAVVAVSEVSPAGRSSDGDENVSEPVKRLLERIDELTREHEDLRRREELFRAIIDQAQDLIFSKDMERRYILVNPAMEKLHRRSASEIPGLTAHDLMPGVAGDRISAVDSRVLAGETVEEIYTTPINETPLTFHGIRAPLKNSDGKIVGLFGIVRNITETSATRAPDLPHTKGHYPSGVMQETLMHARSVAATDGTVLLLGESGSGKDFLARWIHDHSRRADGRFFSINCAAVSGELADSELFGHEAGAFTGARTAKKGILQLAEGGTLLLNEIGEFSLPLQAKLLTFMDTKSFLRVGGEQVVHVNARIMAATHRKLMNEVAEGRFLSALFYRLNVLKVDVPPLRERSEDIPVIAREIVSALTKEMQLDRIPELDSASLDALANYHWPGNVRELKNVLERALMLWKGGSLRTDTRSLHSMPEPWSHKVSFDSGMSLHEVLGEVAEALCAESIRRCGGSKTEAARLLGISRGVLYRTMKRSAGSRDNDT
jgi:PAS domain S-box-containing protein